MKDRNVKLAELLGWTVCCYKEHFWEDPNGNVADIPDYNTDLNAMREVWKVLKERGLWGEFLSEWAKAQGIETWSSGVELDRNMLYDFLTDLPGQVEAAIKVLEGE